MHGGGGGGGGGFGGGGSGEDKDPWEVSEGGYCLTQICTMYCILYVFFIRLTCRPPYWI